MKMEVQQQEKIDVTNFLNSAGISHDDLNDGKLKALKTIKIAWCEKPKKN